MLTKINSTKPVIICQRQHCIPESIARMEAELQAHKAFIQFMAEESAEQLTLISQAEEAEAITN